MTLSSTTTAVSISALFEELFDGGANEVLCVGFDESQVASLVDVVGESDEPPVVRLLTNDGVAKWVRGDFVLASEAAALVEAGRLSIRTTTERLANVLVVCEDAVVSVITAGERAAGCVADEATFVAAVTEEWTGAWEDGEEFSLRTPGRSRVETSLGEALGPELAEDFRAMVETLGDTRGDGFGVIDLCLLVAAKHERQLYDISRWGEDTGIAGRATFSRRKTVLEEMGLVETGKLPSDVGRPRLRLFLSAELRGTTAAELPALARELSSADAE